MSKSLDNENFWQFPEMDPRVPPGRDDPMMGNAQGGAPESGTEFVRRNKLARARKLAADPNYPPDEILASLAEMFARHWYD